ncbi:MAG: NAD-dependent protein deacylase [Candidatus Fimenecus sp.]
MDEKILQLKEILTKSRHLCVFTGAGISCPSGIPDFRSADGLYNQKSGLNIPPEEIISHTFFTAHTDLFYDFYKSKMLYPNAQPNAAHRFFADLEREGKTVSVVTQNIDGLHTAAGSSRVFEIHGSVLRNHCMHCGAFYGLEAVAKSDGIPHCTKCGGVIKPDVVLYEEPLEEKTVQGAIHAIAAADTMVIIGTSLVVYPAASYVRYFGGEKLVILNKTATEYDRLAQLTIYDDIVHIVEQIKAIYA